MRRREPFEREGTAGDSSNKEVTGEIGAVTVTAQRSRDAVRRRFMEAEQQRSAQWRSVQAATRRRRQGAWLAYQSAHQRRATEILSVFDVEVRSVAASALASFLLHYVCCEALGKLLIGSAKNILPHEIFQRSSTVNIDLRSLGPAVRRLAIPISDGALHIVFQGDMETAGQRSCRVLRNRVIHELQSDHVAEVNHRLPELTKHMADFIEGVRVRSGAGHLF
jgi:hypothetical protein